MLETAKLGEVVRAGAVGVEGAVRVEGAGMRVGGGGGELQDVRSEDVSCGVMGVEDEGTQIWVVTDLYSSYTGGAD